MGKYVSKEQYRLACSADLYRFLLLYHRSEVIEKYGSVLLRADEHVSVKRGFHGYKNFKTGESGNCVDYLRQFLGYTFPDAVLALIGENTVRDLSTSKVVYDPGTASTASKPFSLPEPVVGPYRNLFAFLINRKIPAGLIRQLIDEGLLYQSAQDKNIIFVSRNRDYYEVRGTNTFADRRCRYRDRCPDYRCAKHQWCTMMDTCSRYHADPFHGGGKGIRPGCYWCYTPAAARSLPECTCAKAPLMR